MKHAKDSTPQLLEHQANNTEVFSLKFLDWLVSEEEMCDDAELKAQMSDFAGRLVSLRRGIVPTNANAALPKASTKDSLPNPDEYAQATETAGLRRWPVQSAWQPEYEVALHERVPPLACLLQLASSSLPPSASPPAASFVELDDAADIIPLCLCLCVCCRVPRFPTQRSTWSQRTPRMHPCCRYGLPSATQQHLTAVLGRIHFKTAAAALVSVLCCRHLF